GHQGCDAWPCLYHSGCLRSPSRGKSCCLGKGQRVPACPSRTAQPVATPDRRNERTPFSRPFGNLLSLSENSGGRANIFSPVRLFRRHGRGTANASPPTVKDATPNRNPVSRPSVARLGLIACTAAAQRKPEAVLLTPCARPI